MARPRKRSDHYEALAIERGFMWLGPEVTGVGIKTTWRCAEGHSWAAAYERVHHGTGCPQCAIQKRRESQQLKTVDYEVLATERGLRWLGPMVSNVGSKTKWLCKEGHYWDAAYSHVKRGKGCTRCTWNEAGAERRLKASNYEALATERGFVWLGPTVALTSEKTGWQCDQGHCWLAPYGKIWVGTGCPSCALGKIKEKLRLQATDYEALGRERGFVWLGPEVANTTLKTNWQCPEGHSWTATYSTIRQGSGCRWCAIKAAAERDRLKAEHYNALGIERGFVWLGPEVPNNRAKTGWQCREGHCWESTYACIKQGRGCPECAMAVRRNDRQLKPAHFELLASKRSLTWLGPEVRNRGIKTRWQCRHGHSWEASYGVGEQRNRKVP